MSKPTHSSSSVGTVGKLHQVGQVALTLDVLARLRPTRVEQRRTGCADCARHGIMHAPCAVAIAVPVRADLEEIFERVVRGRADCLHDRIICVAMRSDSG